MSSEALAKEGVIVIGMYYVYLIESLAARQQYIGFSTDLAMRLKAHNQGKSVHTNKFKPWKLTTYIAFDTKEKAQHFERYLKTGSGIAFQRKHL